MRGREGRRQLEGGGREGRRQLEGIPRLSTRSRRLVRFDLRVKV